MTDLVDQMIRETWEEHIERHRIASHGFRKQTERALNAFVHSQLRAENPPRDNEPSR